MYIYIQIVKKYTSDTFDYLCYYIPTHGTHLFVTMHFIYIHIYNSKPLSAVLFIFFDNTLPLSGTY